MSDPSLSICSYNIHGYNSTKYDYIGTLLKQCDILMIQEHWLNNSQLDRFSNLFQYYSVHGVSAIDTSTLLQGRPHGGCCIIYNNYLTSCIKIIPTVSNRLCCLSLSLNSIVMYMFCVYMPCNVNNNTESLHSYIDVLSEISVICDKYNAQHICIGGDMNTDLSRVNCHNTEQLSQFKIREHLHFAIEHPLSNVAYTYQSKSHIDIYSIIDHFLLTDYMFSNTQHYSVLDDIDNQSDHLPILLIINCDSPNVPDYNYETAPNIYPRQQWDRADFTTISDYKFQLDKLLLLFDVPIDCFNCTNVLCINKLHIANIQQFHDNIIKSCLDASRVIPVSKPSKHVPGWNEHVAQHKHTAQFWHFIWKQCGSPRNGEVASIMRKTKAKYHYAIRFVKKQDDIMRKNAMAQSISENNSRDLWKEINKIRNKHSVSTHCIDNVTDKQNVSELFATKYVSLYNSVCSSTKDIDKVFKHNHIDIVNNCLHDGTNDQITHHTHNVTVAQIKEGINKLKTSKSDCTDRLLSDHFINATDTFYTYIALLFSCMLCHGISPSGLLLSTMVPVPKNKRGDKSDSNNYRAIAISSILGKLFDYIIIHDQCHSLLTDDLQFGFKECSSTITCTSLLLETIEYYNGNSTDCYLLLLDASKAFDRIEYYRLFQILRERKMCPIVLRLIMHMYISQKMQVKWNNVISQQFDVGNGVKQGGVLSPILFTVYINSLFTSLRNMNLGCKIGMEYMGVFGYADDISLLCPTLDGLQEMLTICEEYAIEHSILFNSAKSKLLHFKSNNTIPLCTPVLQMKDGSLITVVDECTYLGTTIYSDLSRMNVNSAVKDLYMRTNNIMSDFTFSDSNTLSTLHKTYCMNVYGSPLWPFNNNKYTIPFYIAWRKTIRRIWRLHTRTHNTLVHLINGCLPIDVILEKRCIKFIWKLMNSKYPLHKSVIEFSYHNRKSTLAENSRYFMYKYGLCIADWYKPVNFLIQKVDAYVYNHYTIDDICTANAIIDLCHERDYIYTTNQYKTDLCGFITSLCID